MVYKHWTDIAKEYAREIKPIRTEYLRPSSWRLYGVVFGHNNKLYGLHCKSKLKTILNNKQIKLIAYETGKFGAVMLLRSIKNYYIVAMIAHQIRMNGSSDAWLLDSNATWGLDQNLTIADNKLYNAWVTKNMFNRL